MGAHSRLSPSGRHRWSLCPGSIRREEGIASARSESSIDGTHSHTLLEKCINEKQAANNYIGQTLDDHDGVFTVDKDRAGRVQLALDYINQKENADIKAERKVSLKWFTGRDDLNGTLDCQIESDNRLEIIDYKDGYNMVEAENNLQLEQYAVGVLSELGLPLNTPEKYPWREVTMTIIQPKLAMQGLHPIMSWTVPIGYLLTRVRSIQLEAMATDSPDALLVPGEKQCRYCPSKGSCTALVNKSLKEVGLMFSPVKADPIDLAQQSANKDPSNMSDDRLYQIIEAAPLLRKLLDAVEEEVLNRLKSGKEIKGLKMINGRGSRAWSLTDDEMEKKLIKMGIPKGSIYVTKFVSPAQVEKLSWVKRDGTECQLSELQLKRLDEQYITRIAGKLTVAFESDPRPAVVMNAAPMFSAVVPVAPVTETMPSWLS